ncbi:hypothetical protein HAX54_020602, partial [Datura stramonium]|nr:hypothetical protein [Datura stramonium]
NGSPSSYSSNGNIIQEFIIMDQQKKPTKLTLWEEFIDHYGNKLFTHLKQLNEFPVILAKKVGKPKSSLGLTNRFGTIIHINPPYPQAVELKIWAKTMEPMLNSYATKSTATTGSLVFVPFEEHIIPVINIQQQPS